MDIIRNVNKVLLDKDVPRFQPGDTIRVYVKIVEKIPLSKAKAKAKVKVEQDRVRPQMFEGVVIRRRNAGISSSFAVRKISSGVGVERLFPLYSARIEKIEVIRQGKVRRCKLYYLRELRGKAARLKEIREDRSAN